MKSQPQPDHLPSLLKAAGLRPTRQRMALAAALFDGCHKHVTAEQVHNTVRRNRSKVSLATVYNALHSFTEAGLLREVVIDSSQVYFDTNVDNHHHFYDPANGELYDVHAKDVKIGGLPKMPRGRKLDRVDVIIRLKTSS